MSINWKCFPLEQVNSKEGPDWHIWEQPDSYSSRGILALRAGEAARRQGDEAFERNHMGLLKARHVDRKKINERPLLVQVAKEAGLDLGRFERDLDDRELLKKVGADYTEARKKYGVFGTPTLVFESGAAAFLKMMPPPSSDEAVPVFDSLYKLMVHQTFIHEVKRPSLEE